MGLCKCPKRKVTNLFCFEHDVNVCEHCIVSEHERCIVQSYVQWLQDSDYTPICILCKGLLSDEPTVRLVCYDVFHWSCLNKYALSLPSNTAPAGYQCPRCKECIFPPNNIMSPVAESLRAKLSDTTWARVGLGQSMIDANLGDSADTIQATKTDVVVSKKQQEPRTTDDKSKSLNTNVPRVHSNTKSQLTDDLYRAYNHNLTTSLFDTPVSHSRGKTNQETVELTLNANADRDIGENKYKKRPIMEWLRRLLRSQQIDRNKNAKPSTARQRRLYILLILLLVIFLMFLMTLNQFAAFDSTADDNESPEFDPLNNPNIRVE